MSTETMLNFYLGTRLQTIFYYILRTDHHLESLVTYLHPIHPGHTIHRGCKVYNEHLFICTSEFKKKSYRCTCITFQRTWTASLSDDTYFFIKVPSSRMPRT